MGAECESYRKGFSEYLDGELREPALSTLREHLRVCPECSQELERWRRTVQSVAALPRRRPHEGFARRVLQRLAGEAVGAGRGSVVPLPVGDEERRRRSAWSLSWSRALPVAAALLLAVGFTFAILSGGAGPQEAAQSVAMLRLPAQPQEALPPATAAAPVAPPRPAPARGTALGEGLAGGMAGSRADELSAGTAPRPRSAGAEAAGAPVAEKLAVPAAPGLVAGAPAAVRAKEAAALNEPSSEAATGRRERVSALGASGGGLAAGPEKETVAGSGALRDRTLSRLARGSAFPESREPEGERLVFSQTRLADAKNAAQPVQQVLTLVDSDPAALARRAVLTANQEGLSASLALADERGAGAVEVYLTVPRAQYERLLAELSNLAPPGKQTLANTAEAKDAYLFQAKANYEQTQNARAGGGQGGVGYATAAPEKGLSAAGPEGGSRAALDSAHLDLSERLAAEAQPVGLLVRIGRPGTVSLEAR